MGEAKRRRQYKLMQPDRQKKAHGEFMAQSGIDKSPVLVMTAIVWAPDIVARMQMDGSKWIDTANNEREYVTRAAARVFTHFNPDDGYCAEVNCLGCGRILRRGEEIDIVALAMPPFEAGKSIRRLALASGFICTTCDVAPERAMELWSVAVGKDAGLKLTNPSWASA